MTSSTISQGNGGAARYASLEEENVVQRLYREGQINRLQVEDIYRLHNLIKHGAKFVDVRVRKDAKEYLFEADWLKQLLRELLDGK